MIVGRCLSRRLRIKHARAIALAAEPIVVAMSKSWLDPFLPDAVRASNFAGAAPPGLSLEQERAWVRRMVQPSMPRLPCAPCLHPSAHSALVPD